MAPPADSDEALLIPPDAPQSKFVRYARAVSSDYAPLFPKTPATRPMVVGVDLHTLGSDPSAYEQLVGLLRREELTPKLLQYADDDTDLGQAWMQATDEVDLHVINFTGLDSAARFMDALEFTVSTIRGQQRRGWRKCHTFDVYSVIDASQSHTSDLSLDDRIRAAVLAAAGYGLGTDVIVTQAPTVGRADVGDNDIVTTVRPDDLHPVFGHYLRMTGNRDIDKHTFAGGEMTTHTPSIAAFYDAGIDSHIPFLQILHIVAASLGKLEAVAEIDSLRTRLRRAARALDEVIAALNRSNGREGTPSRDTVEVVSEAFDRELLYLTAVFDGYGRAFLRWLDPTAGKQLRKSLHSAKTLDDYVEPNYPGAPQMPRIRRLQRFAYTIAELRNRIHDAVLPTGAFANRQYGSAQAIAIDIDEAQIELTQELVDRLGVWRATQNTAFFPQTTTVADIATTAVELFLASLEYLNLFSQLIICTKPESAPRADDLLGKVTDNGAPPPQPHPYELLYRRLFNWQH